MAGRSFNFTKAALEALPVPEKRTRYADDKTRGLVVSVMPSGSKTFYFYRFMRGRPVEEKIGPFPQLTIDQARKRAGELWTATDQAEDPGAVRRAAKAEKTFAELFGWWYESYAKPRRLTHKSDKEDFDRYLGTLAAMKLSAITKADMRRIHAHIGQHHGARTANKALEMVRAVFNRAIRHDLYDKHNPVLGVEMYPRESRERRLMPNEVAAFFKAVEDEPSEQLRDFVMVSLFTGARQGNVLAMRWEQVDLAAGAWHIPRTKNGRPQTVTLGAVEIAILERRRLATASEWVFPGREHGGSYSSTGHMMPPKTGWKRILDRTGIKDFRKHDLRRSLGSWMVDTGASLPIIGKALGHQSQAATAIYARLSLDPVREAKERAIGALLEAAKDQ